MVSRIGLAKAKALFAGVLHLWDVGTFLFSTTVIFDAIARHRSRTIAALRAAFDAAETSLAFIRLDATDVSIDYAEIKRTDNLKVVPYGGVEYAK